jgi:hypothetical protein
MAGDWIKMRGNLWDDPRVGAIVDATDTAEAAVIGGLYWLWATADQHTEDGVLPGLSLARIDRKTGVSGFAQALCDIGWLADHPEGVRIVRFDDHNGQSAKRRCTDAQRKANSRTLSASDADTTRTDAGQEAPNLGAREREEKIREKKPPKPPRGEPEGFAEWYLAYPKKEARPLAAKAFAKVTAPLHVLLAALEWQKRLPAWTKDKGQYVPLPATYLNAERWNDERGDTSVTVPTNPAAIFRPEPALTPEQLEANRKRGAEALAKLKAGGLRIGAH